MPFLNRREFLLTSAAAGLAAAPATAHSELPFRQVHLDFHTSELIPDVAADFDAREFAATLKAAHVNSINVFAKCHHGLAYYDTAIAQRHPALKIDLLGQMVTACKAAGIHVLYYYSLVWDVATSRKHPDWMVVTRDGHNIGGPPTDAWPWICMNTPYLDQVLAENEELVTKYDTDGAWFDILKQHPDGCFCHWCTADRKKLGLKDDPESIRTHNKLVAKRVEEGLNRVVHKRFPNGLTFYNSRLVVGVRDELDYYSHIEIESLPTGGWGYTHFQQRVRYMRTLGKDMVGMTGRFHKSWGDFGGLKNQAALDFECLNFLANGAKACVGDQLHPRGRLDKTTYARIGKTYTKVEALEPWTRGAQAVADIGVISTALFNTETTQKITPSDQGFTNMLVELHQQFNVIDLAEDFRRYQLLILPDEIRPSKELLAKLDEFVTAGGSVIASAESLLDPRMYWFYWKPLGLRYQGKAKFRGEYMLAKPGAFPSLDESAYYLYQPGHSVAVDEGTEVLATYGHPYFDRTPERFSSHKQTPLGQRTEEPLITLRGKVCYIANPIFRSYALDGVGAYKLVVGDLLQRLLPQPVVTAPKLPSTAQITLLEQSESKRRIVHLLHYPMTRRAPDIDIIEEPGLLLDQEIRLRLAAPPKRVTLVPQNKPLPFRFENGYAVCRVDRVVGHQAVCFE
ncbi:alpha-amylase family protein [Paludibaculum fermentans]|uniref:alpha-amylase family protein n=1 Tax=Paludibaculum fermentans TaxID=1473598 RepID=UPI003EBD592C